MADYERCEIARALKDHPGDEADEPLRIKIVGQRGETRWMNATPAQARAIADVLGGSATEPVSW